MRFRRTFRALVNRPLSFALPVFAAALLVVAAAIALAADHSPPPVEDAATFPAVEAHEQEKVTIAADPYDTRDKSRLLRVNYYSEYQILPIRVIVTNNGDKPISLADARIHFIARDKSRIEADEPEDVERRVNSADNRGKTIPLPAPLPSIHTASGKRYKEIEEDFHDFEFQALVVEAHTTRAGFLFYDLSGLGDPLRGAKLYLRKIKSADGQDLFYFEIPFDKYLAARPR